MVRKQYLGISFLIFCLILANLVPVSTQANNLEEDPLVPGWSKDSRISNASESSIHPSIVTDQSGTIYIVWQDARDIPSEDGYWGIYFTKSIDQGETWSTPKRINAPSNDGHTPHIIVDQNSIIHLVWSGAPAEENYYEIYYKNSTNGGNTWSEDIRLTHAPDDSFTPTIATYGNTLHLVWSDKRDGNFEIYYKKSTNGGETWGDDVRLTNDSGDSKLPSIAVDLTGNIHVAWYDKRGDVYKIYYINSSDNGVTWNDEICISSDHGATTLLAAPPSLVTDTYGNLHVIWQDGLFGNYKIYYREKIASNNTWSVEEEIVDVLFSCLPSVVIDSNDGLHMVWLDGDNNRLYYKSKGYGENEWSDAVNLTSSGPEGLQLTIDTNNVLHLTWVTSRDGNKEIYYKRTLEPVVVRRNLSITSNPNVLTADGTSTSLITATVTNTTGSPVEGVNVSFTVESGDGGLSSENNTTDMNGNATVIYTAGTITGDVVIKAAVDGVSNTTMIVLVAGEPAQISVSVQPNTIVADGESTSIITAVVMDQYSNPVSDVKIDFSSLQGLGTINPLTNLTDSDGVATTVYTAGTEDGLDTVNVTNITYNIWNTVDVSLVAVLPEEILITSSQDRLVAKSNNNSTVNVFVLDEKGEPVSDAIVHFSLETVLGGSLSKSSVVTDENGSATVVYTAGTVIGDEVIRAACGSVSNNTVIRLVSGPVAEILIYPMNQTNLCVGDGSQFNVTGYDQYGNLNTSWQPYWHVDGNIGTINETGFFLATKKGVGAVNCTDNITGVYNISVVLVTVGQDDTNNGDTNNEQQQPSGDGENKQGINLNYVIGIVVIAVCIIIGFLLVKRRGKSAVKTREKKTEKPTLTLRCPKCRKTFRVEVKPKPFKVKCPFCGKEGEIK